MSNKTAYKGQRRFFIDPELQDDDNAEPTYAFFVFRTLGA